MNNEKTNQGPQRMTYWENVTDRLIHPGEAFLITFGDLGILYSVVRFFAWGYGVTQGSGHEYPSEINSIFPTSCVIKASGTVIRNSRLTMEGKRE